MDASKSQNFSVDIDPEQIECRENKPVVILHKDLINKVIFKTFKRSYQIHCRWYVQETINHICCWMANFFTHRFTWIVAIHLLFPCICCYVSAYRFYQWLSALDTWWKLWCRENQMVFSFHFINQNYVNHFYSQQANQLCQQLWRSKCGLFMF